MDLKIIVSLNGPAADTAGYVRFANLILEECRTNPMFKEFVMGADGVPAANVEVAVEGFNPIKLQGFYMNEARSSSINHKQVYLDLADEFKKLT